MTHDEEIHDIFNMEQIRCGKGDATIRRKYIDDKCKRTGA
jgi:hypothetical protein